jgi:hypothetical protein
VEDIPLEAEGTPVAEVAGTLLVGAAATPVAAVDTAAVVIAKHTDGIVVETT